MKWAGAALVLYVSTDYDGTSNPTQQGTWTDITSLATWDVDNTTWGNWTNSGDVDLTSYISPSTYIAYEYFGSSSSGSTWEIDNIIIIFKTIYFPIFTSKYNNVVIIDIFRI